MNNVKTDCFAFDDKKCTALNKLYCAKGDCNFFKTKKQYKADLQSAEKYNKKYGIEQGEKYGY